MAKTKIRFVDIIYWLAIIGADIFFAVVGVFAHSLRFNPRTNLRFGKSSIYNPNVQVSDTTKA